jgi:tetratricopeptide (TPR) repeat protein
MLVSTVSVGSRPERCLHGCRASIALTVSIGVLIAGCGVSEEPEDFPGRRVEAAPVEKQPIRIATDRSLDRSARSADIFAIKEGSSEALPALESEGLSVPAAAQRQDAGHRPDREQGLKAAAEGRHDEAIEKLTLALQEKADDWQARFVLANELAVAGKPQVALVHLKRILTVNPKEPEALTLRGIIQLQMNRHDAAAEDLLAAIDRPSPSPRALAYAAMAMLELGRNDEAERLATRSLEKRDRFAPIAYQVRGHARVRLKRVDEAAHDLSELEKIGPADKALEVLRSAVAAGRQSATEPLKP